MERLVTTSDGAVLWITSSGAGPAVILCNGGPGCCDYLAPVAAMLEDRCTVIRWEQRGCGRSSPDGPFDLANTLSDLVEIQQAYGLESSIVGGHSWGSNLATVFALVHPERTRAVIGLSGTGFQNDRTWHAAYERGKEERPELLPEFAYPHNMTVNRECMRTYREWMMQPDLWRNLSRLDVPVLLVNGSEDIRPSWPVAQLARLLPKGEFHLIEGGGHHTELTHPEVLSGILQNFLASLELE